MPRIDSNPKAKNVNIRQQEGLAIMVKGDQVCHCDEKQVAHYKQRGFKQEGITGGVDYMVPTRSSVSVPHIIQEDGDKSPETAKTAPVANANTPPSGNAESKDDAKAKDNSVPDKPKK